MILLVTNKRDLTSDFIVLELGRRGIEVFRLNSEDLPSAQILFRPGIGWNLRFGDRSLNLDDVSAAYYRRPGTPDVRQRAPDQPTRDYLASEWMAIQRSLWNALEGRWLNSPFAILRAEDKPRQLSEALASGFAVPQTLIGNDFDAISSFTESNDTIGKPLRHALLDHKPNKVLFTSRLGSLTPDDRRSVEIAPVIYQREIPKVHDVRVTVVGEKAFSVAIHSQIDPETQVDWRRGARMDLPHEVIELPQEVEARCVDLTKRLGLRFGALDLVSGRDGIQWFMELNPNGQWAWIERRTGLPITAAIVNELVGIGT